VSDTDACADLYRTHHTETGGAEATRACLEGGTDVNSGATYTAYLATALAKGLVSREAIDRALRRSYGVRFALGLFDANPSPYDHLDAKVHLAVHQTIHTSASSRIARPQAASKCAPLLMSLADVTRPSLSGRL